MKTYGQFCPVAKAAQLVCQRWTPLLIRDLAGGPLRFSELQRGVPSMSPSLLTKRLRELQEEGVVVRADGRGSPYELTEAGRELVGLVVDLGVWGQRWTRRELARDELDLGLFLWAFERAVHPEAFGDRRVLVELELTDQPAAKRRWWLINESSTVQLCLEDPGFEVDVYVCSTLRDMVYVWRGDLALAEAMEEERIDVHASTALRRAFRDWFGLSTLAHVESRRGG
jgi:DNA-binding HxlR family transcriptional regulator